MNGFYTILLLIGSNVFMTLAWYGHLKLQQMNISTSWPLIAVIALSWAIAFFEYLIQVPANRIGHAGHLSLAQLKILQEVISLTVFVPFSILYMGEPVRWNFLWAGVCMIGAVYFIFKG